MIKANDASIFTPMKTRETKRNFHFFSFGEMIVQITFRIRWHDDNYYFIIQMGISRTE